MTLRTKGWIAATLLVVGAGGWYFLRPPASGTADTAPGTAPQTATAPQPVIPSDDEVHALYAGSASCKECHEVAYEGWINSNHGLAERDYRADLDEAAFVPRQTLEHSGETSEMFLDAEGVATILTRGLGGERQPFRVTRVIGHDPLRQFLIPAPGNRLQTCDVSYDPHNNEWFDVYGDDHRVPGEWGSWTGRGMNWNSMCAACHNTRLRKNYDPPTDSYHTRMAEMTVGCEACHGPMKDHVEWQKNPPPGYSRDDLDKNRELGLVDPTIKRQTKDQMLHTCAACHSRRGEVSGDLVPGENYFDHFALMVVDETDIYHPDGQVRDENYVFAAFLASKKHHAGVRCGDCHEPHSNQLLIPGNLLCMRCHMGGTEPPAPVIDPATHSPCAPDSIGRDCVGCHMPHTTYMERHPRRDHGFTIPDPLLTKEFGIPNSCNRCHTDKDVDWALAKTDEWYGEKMNRPTRTRAILIARARRGEPDTRPGLIDLLKSDPIPSWRATACHMLERWSMMPDASAALISALNDDSPLVREAAVRSLIQSLRANMAGVREAIRPLLDDELRSVRVAAAWALADEIDLKSQPGRELVHMLDMHSDQPTGRMQLSQFAYLRGDTRSAVAQIRKAIEWDPYSPPFHHDLAILLSMTGDNRGAIKSLREAIRLDPNQSEYHFKLALALNETGQLKATAAALEQAVALDPAHSRAWYNLGLARNSLNRPQDAIAALRQGERAEPSDPAIPYARATIHHRLGETGQAIEAARKALDLRPDFEEARRLLDAIGPGNR